MKADEILNSIEDYLKGGGKVADLPLERWEDMGMTLNFFLADEHDKLSLLEQKVAQKKLDIIDNQEKRNIAEAEARVEATDLYLEMKKQKRKVDRIEETIRLVKLRARRDI